ncbi:cupin domain-containing protein [Paenarthrobacter sp. YAF11_1]|uniref:cupin domain-containing protein n=1 Tax=Paenarthrobacter sp. YAF11_1 TaxID=3233074 RepID=UPI003F9D5A81
MTEYAIPAVEEVHDLKPVINDLPGAAVPFAITSGEGKRYDLGDTLVTVFARPEDTAGQFGAAWITGKKGAESPFTSTPDATFIHVMDGQLRVWLPGEAQVLVAGDSVSIPAGTPWAWRMEAHYNRYLSYSTTGAAHQYAADLGSSTDSHVFSNETITLPSQAQQDETAERFGIRWHDLAKHDLPAKTGEDLPEGPEAFITKAGGGDRWRSMEQLNTYLTRNKNTDDQFFALMTRSAPSPYFPRHFHRLHSENFICVDGRVRIYVNGEEILLTKGDFVHAPAGTIHSFAIEANNTQLLGLLTPGIFEPFFEFMGEATSNRVQVEGGNPQMPFAGFMRAQEELDLVVAGPPPGIG